MRVSLQAGCMRGTPPHLASTRVEHAAETEFGGSTGREPATSCVTGRRSNQLTSYPLLLHLWRAERMSAMPAVGEWLPEWLETRPNLS